MLQSTTSKKLELEWVDGEAVFHYGRADQANLSLRQAAVLTASIINEDAGRLGRQPTVLLSGGLDSEVVIKAFIETGQPFRCVTFRYKHGLNSHETQYVERFVSALNLNHQYLDIDIERWVQSSEAEALFVGAQAAHFEIVPHLKTVSEVWNMGGYPVLGCMEVVLENMRPGWYHAEYSHDASWYLHAINNGISGAMGFYQHTPELLLAQLTDPRTKRLAEGRNLLANTLLSSSRQVKYQMYRDHWPELQPRPKFDGGEQVRLLLQQHGNRLEPGRFERAVRKRTTSWTDMVARLTPVPQQGG